MPTEEHVATMKRKLHPSIMDKIRIGCRDEVMLAFMASLHPEDLQLEIDTAFEGKEDEDDTEKTSRWMDSYDAQDVVEMPTFVLDGWYRPKGRIRRTDLVSLSITLTIDPGILAEGIASMKKIYRKTLANLVIASYVKDNEYLEDVLEEENDNDSDETGDAIDFDEWLERRDEIAEIHALMYIRSEIIEGTFGILPTTPFIHQEELLEPDEVDRNRTERSDPHEDLPSD